MKILNICLIVLLSFYVGANAGGNYFSGTWTLSHNNASCTYFSLTYTSPVLYLYTYNNITFPTCPIIPPTPIRANQFPSFGPYTVIGCALNSNDDNFGYQMINDPSPNIWKHIIAPSYLPNYGVSGFSSLYGEEIDVTLGYTQAVMNISSPWGAVSIDPNQCYNGTSGSIVYSQVFSGSTLISWTPCFGVPNTALAYTACIYSSAVCTSDWFCYADNLERTIPYYPIYSYLNGTLPPDQFYWTLS
jgi:hypothetical protein